MSLEKLRFKPGIDKTGTQYSAENTWYDGDKVRFTNGRPEKIGGWSKVIQDSFKGVCRSLMDWRTSGGVSYIGIGTSLKFYVEEAGTGYFDITPVRATSALTDPFSADGSTDEITVTDTDHSAVLGDFITISGATSLGGAIVASVLNQEYRVAEIIDGDNYTILAVDTSGDTVNSTGADTAGGGVAVSIEYQLNIGTNAYVSSAGYGYGPYGSGSYGISGSYALTNNLRLYSQDVYNQDLVFCPRGGGLYYWDESAGTSSRAVNFVDLGGTGAPTSALQVMVSDIDRHVIAFGANPLGSSSSDPMLVRWSDQENPQNWTPSITNTAGGTVLSMGSTIVGAIKTRREILVFTDTSIMSMRYGSEFVYTFSTIADNATMISPSAGVAVGDRVFFMGRDEFYMYEGGIRALDCTVHDYVYQAVDQDQEYKIFCGYNKQHDEVVWYYPRCVDSGDCGEITDYVSFGLESGAWAIGTLPRGAWYHGDQRSYPLSSSVDVDNEEVNYLYNHEIGYDADGSALDVYAETGGIDISQGDNFSFVRRVIPDVDFIGSSGNAQLDILIKKRNFPLNAMALDATLTTLPTTDQLHTRVRAREIAFRLESSGTGFGWTAGDIRVDKRTDGRR
jgi:hypothetical protein